VLDEAILGRIILSNFPARASNDAYNDTEEGRGKISKFIRYKSKMIVTTYIIML
jgi:hypothetical protein